MRSIRAATMIWGLLLIVPTSASPDGGAVEPLDLEVPSYFTLDNGLDLRSIEDDSVRLRLTRVKGRGAPFGVRQRERYCGLKQHPASVQWVVNDLTTGELLSSSLGADRIFFGASTSKLFVAAALLDKQEGSVSESQLALLVRMIVVSDNASWLALQRQVGDDGTDDSGRAAVQRFVRGMSYPTIRGFQGWMRQPDGSRTHGNELNSLELSRFLYDTYQRNYDGADVLWKIMQATKTGASKIDKYTPAAIYIGGKTGTYSGPNESPDTVDLPTIKARNHAAVLSMGERRYGISILSNTGDSEDVAVLGGGLMREHLGVEPVVSCP